jgi:putative ABC transport system permease protein
MVAIIGVLHYVTPGYMIFYHDTNRRLSYFPITEVILQIAEAFPNARVTAMRQAVMSKMQSIEMSKSFSPGVSILVIGIGALLVMVTMMGSVNERTRKIGIFRAIGFRQTHIMQIILLEALVLGLFGGIVGFAVGNLVAWVIIPVVIKNGIFAGINYQLGGLCLLMVSTLSLLSSLYPAFKSGSGKSTFWPMNPRETWILKPPKKLWDCLNP